MHPGVSLTSDDTEDWRLPVVGPGLLLDVPARGRWLQRSSLHLEAAPRYRLRLGWRGQPLLWARIASYWDQCVLVRGPADVRGAFPLLTAPDVRAVGHEPGTPAWWEAWARQWGRMLVDASESVLYTGRWCLRPVRAISADQASGHAISTTEWSSGQPPMPPHSLDAVLRFHPAWVENRWERIPDQKSGTVLPLRAPSDAEDGRIKSWRKRARDATLPPALLLYMDILGKWLLLDGHDRIHAALLEGREPPLMGLWPVVEKRRPESKQREEGALLGADIQLRAGATPEVIDRVNRQLLHGFNRPERGTVTRAWPVTGGIEVWQAELRAWRKWNPTSLKADDWDWLVSDQD